MFAVILLTEPLAADDSGERVDFAREIKPIFTAHCTSCHGGVVQYGGVSFVYEDTALETIEPGDPENSWLFEKVTTEDEDERMPPPAHGPGLSEKEVQLLRRWIEQGAQWSKHWAYERPKRSQVDQLSNPDWPLQPIDRFVLQQLDQRDVTPSEDERPERWLRRVTLDLTGLPPTLDEREEFLNQLQIDQESAYINAVDRLLASPHFGERWASVWFDQVRYADSRGQGEDSPRTIWKYRDWVIDALNEDLPYDQFTIKQLAGDLLPNPTIDDRIATAVHRLTHTNEEGGTDDEEFRIEAVLDRVNTTWQTWQGTTFGCAQCHDHPYDPFAHDEYYKFVALFNNTADCDLSDDWPKLTVPIDKKDYATANELQTNVERLARSVWDKQWSAIANPENWRGMRMTSAATNRRAKLVIDSKPDWDEFYTSGTISSGTRITLELAVPDSVNEMTGLRITGLPLDPEKALSDSEWGFVMSHIKATLLPAEGEKQELKFKKVIGDEPFPYYDPSESLNAKSKAGFGPFTRIHHARSAVLIADKTTPIPAGSKIKLEILHRVTELAAFPLLTRRGHVAITDRAAVRNILDDEGLLKQQAELADLKKQLDAIKSTTVPVLTEREPQFARPSHVFVRGLFLTKDKQVQGDVPDYLRDGSEDERQLLSDRLKMAKWLVSDKNPLTARVAVNRYWAQMFGVGLVATEEDFGTAGDSPSHPKLLDDLAVRFAEDYKWSVKKLLREIALSRTYRQSSRLRPELLEADSNNRWLARGPRHSLPAEAVRDQMLAISGLLSDKMYGEPVHPPLPPGVWKARRGKWPTPKPGDEDRYRRTVYTYIKRSVPFPIATTFDAPSRDFCSPKRLRSNTPLQPLMLLNDRGLVECATAFAERMANQHEDLEKQIEFGLTVALCREPSDNEIARLMDLYNAVSEEADDQLASATVASVILNLDEVITK